MNATAFILLCGAAYRLRGSGLIGNLFGWLAWAGLVALLAGPMAGLGAFAGKFFSHGKVYMCRTVQDALTFFAISFTRCCLIAPDVGLSLAASAAIVAAYWASGKLADNGKLSDPLYLAEPVAGMTYGALIVYAH